MNNRLYYEIYDKNKLLARGNRILNTISWSNELMYVPSTTIELPIEYSEYITGREEIKIHVNGKLFHGSVTGFEQNKIDETISIDLTHMIGEWEYRQLSTNLAVKKKTVKDLYDSTAFKYPNWTVNYLQDSADRKIDYVYSRQNKLEGLTKTCELTPDLFWRVGFRSERSVTIGTFGSKKQYRLSTLKSGAQNIRIIEEPVIRHDFDSVINMATVYGEKSDSGMSSMSLREVYNDSSMQDAKFPVVILRNGINNERGYDYVEFAKLAPNNDVEYTVIDSEGIALESGIAIEGTFSFNDLAPFNTDGEEITDEDRKIASKTAYDAAVRKLKQSRRKYSIELQTEELPSDVYVGDRVQLVYDNSVYILQECSNYMKKILSINDWFYVTSIGYRFDQNGVETNQITLSKFLHIERESDLQ